jgi:23S rRNA pseudouridine2605 synthase/16S rRNA pseudouridine516 synthase
MAPEDEGSRQRLQKVLSAAGLFSRRRAEMLMQEGRIRINGELATEMGVRVDPDVDVVSVDGQVVPLKTDTLYIMLNKPKGVLSTMADEQARPDLSLYVRQIGQRVVNIGRLDADTTGLLLLSNDGDLVHRLSHPSFEISKVYTATVKGVVDQAVLKKLTAGVELDDGVSAADRVKILGEPRHGSSIVEIVLHSGKNRVIRRMMEAVGNPVIDLHRKAIGGLHLGGLKPGTWRELTTLEVKDLLTLAHRADAPSKERHHDREA